MFPDKHKTFFLMLAAPEMIRTIWVSQKIEPLFPATTSMIPTQDSVDRGLI